MITPVWSAQAEMAVIGSALIEPAAARRMLQMMELGDFYHDPHRRIFEAIRIQSEESPDLPVDAVTTIRRLQKTGELENLSTPDGTAIGPGCLRDCINAVSSAGNIEHYIKIVRDDSIQRKINDQFERAKIDQSPDNMKYLGDLLLSLQGNRGVHIFDAREDLGAMVEDILTRSEPGIMTGFRQFDGLTDGVKPTELWTIGARPGAGKTAFMLKIACNMAQELAVAGNPNNDSVLYFTSEMRIRDLIQRVLPMATGIPHSKFRSASLNQSEVQRVMDACADGLSSFPLKMIGRPYIGIEDIKGAIFQSKSKVVFIDYLQRCKLPRAENMAYQIQLFMAELKSVAVDCGITIFIGCQADRELDRFPDSSPMMSHLKGSGGIESESDGVVMLWEPSLNVIAKRADWVFPRPHCRAIEGIIRKSRNGENNVTFNLELEGALIKLTDREGFDSRQGEMYA